MATRRTPRTAGKEAPPADPYGNDRQPTKAELEADKRQRQEAFNALRNGEPVED